MFGAYAPGQGYFADAPIGVAPAPSQPTIHFVDSGYERYCAINAGADGPAYVDAGYERPAGVDGGE